MLWLFFLIGFRRKYRFI